MLIKKMHNFHIVDYSPWPLVTALRAFIIITGAIFWFSYLNQLIFLMGILITIFASYQWWRDVTRERTYQGLHTIIVIKNIKIGIILFITSEALFFLSFFWAFFHRRLAPIIEIGILWPPIGVNTFNPFEVPLLNTIILLSSGVTITWTHHRIIESKFKIANQRLLTTIILGLYFTSLQLFEYYEAIFSVSDSIFGATFFVATGFHGLHVIIGTTFLIVCFIRLKINHFSILHHFGFEAAAWYWHFVDVVWLFLFINIYWWRN